MAQAIVAAFLTIIAVVALIGNILVVILFLKNRDWLKKVHTCLLLDLAIQDILTAIGLLVLPGFVQPSDAYTPPQDPTLGEMYCRVIWSMYIPFALAIASVYTCLMLTIDRWSAVLRPMSYRRFSNSRIAIWAMLIVPWIAGLVFEATAILNADANEVNGSILCSWLQEEISPKKTAVALVTFIGMIIFPAILIIIAYVMIVTKLRQSSAKVSPIAGNPNNAQSCAVNTRSTESIAHLTRLTRVACAASITIILCWLPDQLYYCLSQMDVVELGTPLHHGLVILAFMNTMLNPFLYSFSNRQYREEFKAILCCKFRRQDARAHMENAIDRNLEGRNIEI